MKSPADFGTYSRTDQASEDDVEKSQAPLEMTEAPSLRLSLEAHGVIYTLYGKHEDNFEPSKSRPLRITYEFGERFPSGVSFCCAGPSLRRTGPLPAVLGVAEAEIRSRCTGVPCVEGAIVGYDDFGLTSASLDGGASGGAAAGATAVLILIDCVDTEQQSSSPEDAVLKKCLSHTDAAQMKRKRRQMALDKWGCRLNGGQAVSNSAGMVNVVVKAGVMIGLPAVVNGVHRQCPPTRRSLARGRVWHQIMKMTQHRMQLMVLQ